MPIKKILIYAAMAVVSVGIGIGALRLPPLGAVTAAYNWTVQAVDSSGNVLNGTASAVTASPQYTVRIVDSTGHVIDSFGMSSVVTDGTTITGNGTGGSPLQLVIPCAVSSGCTGGTTQSSAQAGLGVPPLGDVNSMGVLVSINGKPFNGTPSLTNQVWAYTTSAGGGYYLISVTPNPMTALGDMVYATDASGGVDRVPANTASSTKMLLETGTGSVGAAPGFVAMHGDCTMDNTGLITCTSTNGSLFTTAATTNLPTIAQNGGTGNNNSVAAAGLYLKSDGGSPAKFVKSTGAASGTGGCTNQVVKTLNGDAVPTCVTVPQEITADSGSQTLQTTATTEFGNLPGSALAASGNEVRAQHPFILAGTLKNMTCNVIVGPGTSNSYAATVRSCTPTSGACSAASSSITCTISTSAVACSDNTHTLAINAGDLVNMQYVVTVGGSAPTATQINCGFEFDANY